MEFTFKKKRLFVNFDKGVSCDVPENISVGFDSFVRVIGVSKVYLMTKGNRDALRFLSDGMFLNGTDSDIEFATNLLKNFDYSKTFGYDFEYINDMQMIALYSGLKIDGEVVKIRKAILKKFKSFDHSAKDCFIELCSKKIGNIYDKPELRIISGMLNNFLYYNKNKSNNKNIDKKFVLAYFEEIYQSMVEFSKEKKTA